VTRLRPALLAFAVPIALALAPSAQAQGGDSVSQVLFGAPGQIVSETTVQVSTEGQIVVSFHGDAGTGCAASGLCPYSGTIVVRPQSGAIGVVTYRLHGRTRRLVSLFLGAGNAQYSTAARVERSIPGQPPGLCADTESNSSGGPSATVHNGAVTIQLFAADENTLSTRCAGPLDGDVAGAIPPVTIPLNRLAHGRMNVDLSGNGSFASHGFAGTVSSTLALILGAASKNNSQPTFPRGIKTKRIRNVTEQLTLTRLTGDLTATIQGVDNPLVCRLLDSCGLTGTVGFGQTARDFTGSVLATGPASRPERDFLAALGLSAGNPHGIGVVVVGDWSQGPATAEEMQSGTCTDTAPGGVMFVTLAAGRGQLRGFANATAWRTRCPGPVLSAQSNPLLDAALPRAALGRRTFTIGLRPAGPVGDDGYTLAVHGQLSLVLRRGRITQQVITEPTG
jgi:hypothetical protein